MKKIGIIGSGVVAQTLGSGFLKHGHEVMLGSSDTEKLAPWLADNATGKTGTFNETAQFADIMVLAVKGAAAVEVMSGLDTASVNGKTVIDATNPISDGQMENGVLRFFTGPNDSLMERLQNVLPETHFVKAFNSVGSAKMVNPSYEVQPSMFICGNDDGAKKETEDILTLFGWEVWDMGKVEAARAIEPLCMLWCIPGFLNNQWTHAFKLLK